MYLVDYQNVDFGSFKKKLKKATQRYEKNENAHLLNA